MATLLTTLQVEQVAFEWGGTTRVYRASSISVSSRDERTNWEYSNGDVGYKTDGVYLFFQVQSDYFERISPVADAGNDYIDVINALNDATVTVTFYPIYSVDNTISYTVAPTNDEHNLLNTGTPARNLFRPQASIECRADTRLSELPAWTRTTRTRG